MSDGSNSSNSTIEDTTMASPQPAQPSGSSTPGQIQGESDSTATPMDQDTPSNLQTPTQAPVSGMASPSGTVENQQQQAASPSISAPSTPSNRIAPVSTSYATSPMSGVVATSATTASSSNADTGASSTTTATATVPLSSKAPETLGVQSHPAQASTQPSPQDVQRQQQQQHLLVLQKQAQETHLAQLQQAQAAAAAAAAATASVAQHNLAVGAALQSRKEEELNRKDRTLAEFLPMMENYNPIIPDAVTDYYLSRTGFDCDDVRIKRLLALAAQKFVSDIATDAFQYCKVRQQSQKRTPGKEKKTVLTMEDLSDALGEYGINVKKPDYFM
ncbi:Transcription initiation factor TFIID subunit 10 [Mortierella sp. GBA30]|nr:Transcription initiation factor TFIID subunit 10 [Mortierella sp. GBA30]